MHALGDVNGQVETLMTSARGLKSIPMPATSKGLGAFCCLGLLLAAAWVTNSAGAFYFDDIVNS